jgi:hypothetical protein
LEHQGQRIDDRRDKALCRESKKIRVFVTLVTDLARGRKRFWVRTCDTPAEFRRVEVGEES